MVTGNSPNGKILQPKRLRYRTLALLGIGCVFIVFLLLLQPLYSLNLKLTDLLFVSRPPSPNIVIVGMDDDTFATYGVLANWPRSLYAQAIANLSNARAKVIGIDVLFSDVSPDDEALAAAMTKAGNIVLPLVGTEYQPSNDPKVTYAHILSPLPRLIPANISVGHANMVPDRDGIVRQLPLVIRDSNGQTYPAFSLAVLHTFFAGPLPQEYLGQDGLLHLLSRDIPVNESYGFRIDFAPETSNRPFLSFKDVISGNFDPLVVENKIVLIGMTATGELDKWTIPTSTDKVPGIYIHAAAIDNILRQQFLVEAGQGIDLMIMLLLAGITGVFLPRLGLRWGSVMVGVLFAGYLVACFIAFENGHILNILYPLSILPVSYISNVFIVNGTTLIENSKLNQKVRDGYKSTIKALAASIDAKDHYTRGHSQRVTEFALLAATSLPALQDKLEILEYAGILHDIGKIGIPDSILIKSGPLTPEEWKIMRQHPVIGASIIENIPFLEEARKLALHHHERYDGRGYPEGLAGEDIPLGSRVLAVADSFDSMTSDRAYRKAMSKKDAIKELRKNCGTQLCPVAVEAFVSSLESNHI